MRHPEVSTHLFFILSDLDLDLQYDWTFAVVRVHSRRKRRERTEPERHEYGSNLNILTLIPTTLIISILDLLPSPLVRFQPRSHFFRLHLTYCHYPIAYFIYSDPVS